MKWMIKRQHNWMNINENNYCAKRNLINTCKRKKIDNVKLNMRNYMNYYIDSIWTLSGEGDATVRTVLKLKTKSSKNKWEKGE